MRMFLLAAGLTVGMMWAGSAHAQSTSASSPSSITNILKFPKSLNLNVQPNITSNAPMSYVNQNAPVGGTIIRPNTTGTAFPYKLSSMMYSPGRTNFISSTSTFGSSIFPTPAQMQAAAPSYFVPFQMYRAAPLPAQQ